MVRTIIIYGLLGTLVAGLLTFVLAYFFRSNWSHNPVGRYVLYFITTLTFTFTYILIYPIIRNFLYIFYGNVIVLLLLNIGTWKLAFLLLKVQSKEKKGKHENHR